MNHHSHEQFNIFKVACVIFLYHRRFYSQRFQGIARTLHFSNQKEPLNLHFSTQSKYLYLHFSTHELPFEFILNRFNNRFSAAANDV